MLKQLKISDGRLVDSGDGDGQILVYISPDESERRRMVDVYKLDEHTLNSALDPDELARLEYEPEHVAMIFKRPRNYSSADNFVFKIASTGIFLFRDRLIIVMADDAPLFEGKMFFKVSSLPELVLKLIYRAIFHYEEHLKAINMIAGELEHEISSSMENKHLLNLFTLEKSLVYYLNAINSNGMLIDRLKAGSLKVGFTPENMELLDDILIENNQCREQAGVYSNVLAGLMDARVSIVSNNLNLLMKTLTLITIGIMLPTLVVSIFSMNVDLPFRKDHPTAFWYIVALAVASVASVVGWYRYKKW